MNDAQLRRRLEERSPWRARPSWEADDPDLRAATALPIDYEPNPLHDLRAPGLYLLHGPRRVGKSLEIKRAISSVIHSGANPRLVLYCSCDGLTKQDLRRLVAQGNNITRTLSGPRYWFLDEITAVKGWSDEIKDMRDQNALFRESCVVLTGSSAHDLAAARKNLADRRGGIADSDRLLLPMPFRTFCQALGGFEQMPDGTIAARDFYSRAAEDAVHEIEPWADALADAWELFLSVGGFPRAVGEFVDSGAVSAGFIQGLWDVVAGDAIRSTTMSETEITAFMGRLTGNLCSPINLTSISSEVGMSGHQSVTARIEDLVRAFLAWRCYKLKGQLPNTAAQRKLYLVDPLISQLAHQQNPRYAEPDVSQLTEQQIGLSLARSVTFRAPLTFIQAHSVMYERTDTDAEIDFVGPDLDVPFECKYTDGNWRREAQTMKSRYGRGIMATRSPLVIESSESVWAIPAAMVAWLLGS
jgi:predicted AAA+ superfamily ATPase